MAGVTFHLTPTICLLYGMVLIRPLTPVSVTPHPLVDPHCLRSTEVVKILRVKGVEGKC